ncbi:adenosylcobinamide-phosphate synthase CbiB [Candidatus Manganitrophus noduliformans]|uniref:adenosylcobinamide-phosphate synthase CbiB n=1 Tax=Candidatus Manganitrophus noduliformans TaxID=2606439 RepID=UPI00143C2219|nr:adenosylcobinamide-phosphate synthase CbiB [Candidatus Manganitrophus noduliformans]
MEVIGAVALALLLDLLLGDPRWMPHPVRGMGRLIEAGEQTLRRRFPGHERLAGVFLAASMVLGVYALGRGLSSASEQIDPALGVVVQALLIYFSLAPRDLAVHALRVRRELRGGNLEGAKTKVSMMVGRDVAQLDEKGVIRATVESVAENTVDGVTAPLFFAFLGGGSAAIAYRAANTLDSMVGYRHAPYTEIGWASARFDDLLNLLPARLTAWMMPLAGIFLGGSIPGGYRALLRDGRKHDSPNSGLPEAAMAGLLGVRLGGPHWYRERHYPSPWIGFDRRPIAPGDIVKAIGVMAITTLILFLLFSWMRWTVAG